MRATSPGVHLLSCPGVVESLIRHAGVGPGDLVIDFGAGPGTITAPLAATGARVLAVERDDAFVEVLHRRFGSSVRVVHGDLRRVPLPRRGFAVVSSIPFAVSTPLLRRLLSPVPVRLRRAELVVEWGLARRLTSARPRSRESAWWAARHELRLVRRVPARCFSPAPSVDAAHLSVRPRSGSDTRAAAVLWALLGFAYGEPPLPARRVVAALAGDRAGRRVLRQAGVDPGSAATEVGVGDWARVASVLARQSGVVAPRLPRALRESTVDRGR
ncbi:MAG TPA: rRNA adenine N(6)-methyltransferase family protein [Actinophytocola sp.]|jgi:23S rRNA (adenine-N6)-dimethyltransferase|uniref:ribosomal RNA small subunit methyltransferase A n=1 Tax=Actinophytocola sp. TaxID=1872138 RepID=UPI002F95CBF2